MGLVGRRLGPFSAVQALMGGLKSRGLMGCVDATSAVWWNGRGPAELAQDARQLDSTCRCSAFLRQEPASLTAGAVQLQCLLLQGETVLCRWPLLTVPPCKEGKALRSALPALQVVDSDKFIESNLPRTRQMLAGFHANPATSKKTPLAILHEYASKRSLQWAPVRCMHSAGTPHQAALCALHLKHVLPWWTGAPWAVACSSCALWRDAKRRRLTDHLLPVDCMHAALCLQLLAPVGAAP